MKAGEKISAEKWNAVHNLLVTQGDKNSETILAIVDAFNQLELSPPIIPFKTIENSFDPGTVGEICFDYGYIYICVLTNTWRRFATESWGGL